MRRIAALAAIVFTSCIHYSTEVATPEKLASVAAESSALAAGDALVVAAGDVADCNRLAGAKATAALIEQFPRATVLIMGDVAYPNGSNDDFARCFDPVWGAFKARTKPAPGNHEHNTPRAAGYTAYFGLPLWYSFDLGAWHIVSIDSMEDMSAASPQIDWLRKDLDANAQPCILAFWHHPRFSSGFHGRQRSDPGRRTGELWNVLAAHHAALILNGHDHDYERFQPISGIREIVAGTGGAELRPFTVMRSGSEFADDTHLGVLVLTLHPATYEWRFISVDGEVRDRSSAPEPCVR